MSIIWILSASYLEMFYHLKFGASLNYMHIIKGITENCKLNQIKLH